MTTEAKIEQLKEAFLEKRLEAEKAAYEYFCACELDEDREQAFEIYMRMRKVTRLHA